MKCLGVCSGPVIVAPIHGKLRVVHRIRDRKRLATVVDAIHRDDHRGVKSLMPKKSKRQKATRAVEYRLLRLIGTGRSV